jgi:Bacterial regulatory proteins, luxR family
VTDTPTWLDPLQSRIEEALSRDAWAASCAGYERDGRVEFDTRTNGNVLATVRFQAPGETAVRQWSCSLGVALILAAGGARIEQIWGPNNRAIAWVAVAVINTSWRLPPVAVRLQPINRDRGWAAICTDCRGVSVLPLSRVKMSMLGGRPLGEALSQAVARTTIPGLAKRIRLERDQLGSDFPATAASAAAEVFNTPAAMAGSDGGLATLEWEVLCRDLSRADWATVASSPSGGSSSSKSRRRARINAALDRQAQGDAFGAGIHSPRSPIRIVSLDKPVGSSDESASLGELLPAEPDLSSGLEIADLLASANLTDGERDVFDLLLQDLTQREIAKHLRIAPGTVAALSSRAKQKLRRARFET